MRRRYSRRRISSPRNVVQSFKKVFTLAPTSRAAATILSNSLATGTDSVAAGQTSATDVAVPTGSVIKMIEIQYSCANLVSIASFLSICIQKVHSGQTRLDPQAVGGNPQRNQVFFQKIYSLGKDQNRDITIKFKIPKKYQRIREGDEWHFTRVSNTIFTDNTQAIYKFYR